LFDALVPACALALALAAPTRAPGAAAAPGPAVAAAEPLAFEDLLGNAVDEDGSVCAIRLVLDRREDIGGQ